MVLLLTLGGERGALAEPIVRYEIELFGLTVVHAEFRWLNAANSPAQPALEVVAETVGFADRIYPVRNRYTVFLDPGSGLPLRYEKLCQEAQFQEETSIFYDQVRGVARYRAHFQGETWEQPLLGPTHTLFSAYERIRRHDFDAEPVLSLLVDANGDLWQATARRTRRIRTHDGLFWEVRFTSRLVQRAVRPYSSDLLTNHITRKDATLLFWIRPKSSGQRAEVVRMEYAIPKFRLIAKMRP